MNRLAIALAPLILAASAFSAQAQDPHAGHVMPATPAPRSAPAPVVRPQTPAPPAAHYPHAGHVMPPAPTPPAADPHAGHDMSIMAPAQPDPHAGHDMSTMQSTPADPQAEHGMSAMSMGPPDVPTSADDAGRHPETPVPAAALSGPTHAADLIFGAEAMAASRRSLVAENGDVRTTAVILDRLEAGFGDGRDTYLWDMQGWSGGDINRFWWKSEGEGDFRGNLEEVELQALYSRAISPFWDVQAGLRQDFRPDGKDTTHLVLGLQGLAPYWFEIDAAVFLSTEGDLTGRVEAEYDQRITQRLILQPRLEIDASASDVPELEIGAGLSSIEAGLRLRYEFRKEFAPYVGVEWSRALGNAADYIEARGGEAEDTRFVVGLKAWF
ncbi:copper resistance protein B [Brevundimonas nasdae]|uniref:Copper resistance protein B n=1 Tax=Brevundimonas nasdae TaxID=172043 RepID=A0ACD4VPB9_9CAUL|nr:copper resistance protein B [Brevundimonas nasdae]WOB79923.1 copper resistance protein B [Brevundimonas nasdae]